jgi:hypothetical protein
MIGIESPLIPEVFQEVLTAQRHKDILRFLTGRFGPIPEDIERALRAVQEESRLDELVNWSALCPDLDTFRTRLSS